MDLNNIKELIKQRQATEQYKYFTYGEDYYRQRNTEIMARKKIMCLEDGTTTENYFAANHKMPSGFFKTIVMQEVNYLVGNGITWTDAPDQDAELKPYFDNGTGVGIEEHIKGMIKDARKKGEAWAYAYKDGGQLKFATAPAEQITPYYDELERLLMVVRTYKTVDKNIMLVYDDTSVKRYERARGDKDYEFMGEYGHYMEYDVFNGNIIGEEPHSFGVVPWIPLYSDEDALSALYNLKLKIDVYDIIQSDYANNITDFQEIFYVLKGYNASPDELAKFMYQLKNVKTLPIPSDGDIDAKQFRVPVEARRDFLDNLKKEIYDEAMAVDYSNVSGGSWTNVMIQAMMSNLDMKCDDIEMMLRMYVNQLISFINRVEGKAFVSDFTLSRMRPINRKEDEEIIDIKVKNGTISKQSAVERSPLELDWDTEKERMEDETSPYMTDVTDIPEPDETEPGGEE